MLKIEAVLQPSKLDAVKDALLEAGIEGMTILEARGHGRQKGHTEFYRGREYTVDLLPKVKIEMVISDHLKESAIQAIMGAARTGRIGDGGGAGTNPYGQVLTTQTKRRMRWKILAPPDGNAHLAMLRALSCRKSHSDTRFRQGICPGGAKQPGRVGWRCPASNAPVRAP